MGPPRGTELPKRHMPKRHCAARQAAGSFVNGAAHARYLSICPVMSGSAVKKSGNKVPLSGVYSPYRERREGVQRVARYLLNDFA